MNVGVNGSRQQSNPMHAGHFRPSGSAQGGWVGTAGHPEPHLEPFALGPIGGGGEFFAAPQDFFRWLMWEIVVLFFIHTERVRAEGGHTKEYVSPGDVSITRLTRRLGLVLSRFSDS